MGSMCVPTVKRRRIARVYSRKTRAQIELLGMKHKLLICKPSKSKKRVLAKPSSTSGLIAKEIEEVLKIEPKIGMSLERDIDVLKNKPKKVERNDRGEGGRLCRGWAIVRSLSTGELLDWNLIILVFYADSLLEYQESGELDKKNIS